MRKEKVKELSQKSFAKYGAYANMVNPKVEKLGAEPIEFFRDMAQFGPGEGKRQLDMNWKAPRAFLPACPVGKDGVL